MMAKRFFLSVGLISALVLAVRPNTSSAQAPQPEFRVTVNMVQLNVAVTDNKGNYVTGLRPENFEINEDGVRQKIATFGEGDNPARRVEQLASNTGEVKDPSANAPADSSNDLPNGGTLGSLNSTLAGSNVFVLFDTSNYLYR